MIDPYTLAVLGGAGLSGLGSLLNARAAGGAIGYALDAARDVARIQKELARQNWNAVMGMLPTLAPGYQADARHQAVREILADRPDKSPPAGPAPRSGAAVTARSAAMAPEAGEALRAAWRAREIQRPNDQAVLANLANQRAVERINMNNAYAEALMNVARAAQQAPVMAQGSDLGGFLQAIGPLLTLFGALGPMSATSQGARQATVTKALGGNVGRLW